MCGIVGYAGSRKAVPILLDGLRRLEYRGYDSAGVAVFSEGLLRVMRSAGKVSSLGDLLSQRPIDGSVGLGHTRWATHGGPCENNAHPHVDCSGELAVIHNGIIENYEPLRVALTERGHRFKSETDTEVVAHLIEEKLEKSAAWGARSEAALIEALRLALKEVRGSYALAVMWAHAPELIIAAKSDSPLAIGMGKGENFMASDVPAFLQHTRKVVYLEDGELASMGAHGCAFFDREGRPIKKSPSVIDWDSDAAEKAGYPHFMLKEIHEQPRVVESALRGRLSPLGAGVLERETGLPADLLKTVSQVHIVACGTSWHAGIIGRYLLERHAGLQTQAEIASEFRYRDPILAPGTLVVAISQSGETADTLAAVRLAKRSGAKVLGICNTLGSAIARCADYSLHTRCGPECGVASTKAFLGQLVALNVLAMDAARCRGTIGEDEAARWAAQLECLPGLIERTLKLEPQIQRVAQAFAASEHFLYMGRGVNYPVALEGALKLKEISYVHAEGYPAGEMKHGPLALIDSKMPVLAIATGAELLEKVISNIEEAKARGARVIALCTEGEPRLREKADHLIEVPAVSEGLSPALNVVVLQLLAYHVALLRGCDIDQPRNLAKSVTVE